MHYARGMDRCHVLCKSFVYFLLFLFMFALVSVLCSARARFIMVSLMLQLCSSICASAEENLYLSAKEVSTLAPP